MGNTLAGGAEVHMTHLLVAIVYVPDAVVDGTERDGLPDESAAHQELVTAEVDESLLLHPAHDVIGSVLDGRKCARECALARRISRNRRYLPERFVRTQKVVHIAPTIEGVLHLGQGLPVRPHLQDRKSTRLNSS